MKQEQPFYKVVIEFLRVELAMVDDDPGAMSRIGMLARIVRDSSAPPESCDVLCDALREVIERVSRVEEGGEEGTLVVGYCEEAIEALLAR